MEKLAEKIQIKAIKLKLGNGWQKKVSEDLGINYTQFNMALNLYRTDQVSYDILVKANDYLNKYTN